ncbi:Uncharacterised protein family (UPF0180) [Caloramator fervidus]|uniref:Uncharacterized protein family (UPF0180) n=1 Tax=Caloramator fervidus TaxID=29344 RepID=A0A1H5WGC3_9CLOT|nr:YkuS family protein [Caloramator fervidus]SEF98413.1 Uncharacterised protein family (UPF0180) [Caloramator fervidus]
MIISVEDSLENIYQELKNLGYEVYKISQNIPSDIYIYSETNTPLIKLNSIIQAKDQGSFILNCDNMNLQDIIFSIHHKTYSPLF